MNDVPLLRNSERTDFRRCPQRWWWRWREHLVPIEMGFGPLVFGTLGHLALADYYLPGDKRGPHPAETWDIVTKAFVNEHRSELTGYVDEDTEMGWDKLIELGRQMLINYINTYGADDHWTVLWTERPGNQLVRHPYDKTKSIVRYSYTMDLIIRDHLENGRIRYVDHKFMKQIMVKHLGIDSQNGGYLAIGTHQLRKEGLIRETESVRDLVYNFLRKAVPPDKPRNALGEYLNKDGSVSKVQPSPFFVRHSVEKSKLERNQQIIHIGNEALHMKAFVDKRLPLHKNPTKDCSWDCSFFSLCGIHESGGNVEMAKRALFKLDDPYKEYYEDAVSPKRFERRLAE